VITPGPKKTQKPATAPSTQIKVQLSTTEIQKLKNTLLTQPASLQGKIRMRSVTENGRIKGFRLYPGNDVPLFNKLGLKQGDMVTTINGQSVGDQAAMANIYSQLGSMPELTVEIERQGQKKFIKLPLNR
jgi:general secretion pathway protein C